jgi:hypothetical protein
MPTLTNSSLTLDQLKALDNQPPRRITLRATLGPLLAAATDAVQRSNIEFSKRVWLDRWTAKAPYSYGDQYDAFNFGAGGDCSGVCGIFIGGAILGPQQMSWGRLFSTETFPGPFQGFQQVSMADCLASPSPIKVAILHGGGGPLSHMACEIDGWHLESNGDYGTCGGPNNADGHGYPLDASLWNDWWVLGDASINEDTGYHQQFGYPRILDYSGGQISGADLAAAGIAVVCRYVTDGGPGFPTKLLTRPEADDLTGHNVGIVSNWAYGANQAANGWNQGIADANTANGNHLAAGGDLNAPILFSVDYDAPESDQPAINSYFQAINSVIGLNRTGAYGGYWVIKRLFDAGLITIGWQTEAWSTLDPNTDGINEDSRCALIQRNVTEFGGQTIDGVPCDINDAHASYIGQWGANPDVYNVGQPQPAPAPTPVPPPPDPAAPVLGTLAILVPSDQASQVLNIFLQLLTRFTMLGNLTPVETLAALDAAVKLPGFSAPTPPTSAAKTKTGRKSNRSGTGKGAKKN